MSKHHDPENSQTTTPEFGRSPAGAWKLLLLILLALAFYGGLHFTALGERFQGVMAWRDTMTEGGWENIALFFALTTLFIALGSPRLLFFTVAGFLFGFTGGLSIAMFASLLASLINFNIFRWAGRDWIRDRFGRHRAVDWVVNLQPTALTVFLVRQLPISNVIVNISLALSAAGNYDFMVGSIFGFLPLGIAATLVGSGLADEGLWLGILQLAAAAVVLLIFSFWFYQRRQSLLSSLSRGRETPVASR